MRERSVVRVENVTTSIQTPCDLVRHDNVYGLKAVVTNDANASKTALIFITSRRTHELMTWLQDYESRICLDTTLTVSIWGGYLLRFESGTWQAASQYLSVVVKICVFPSERYAM